MQLRTAERLKSMDGSALQGILKWTSIPGLISFAGGLPAPEMFPVDAIAAAAAKVYADYGRRALQYSSTEGLASLREKLAARHWERDHFRCSPDEIMITSGSQQGLDFSGRVFLNPGDVVVCETPSYSGAISAFNAYQCDYLSIATDENGMILEDLEAKLQNCPRARMIYVIPNFQNPSGRTWSLERRQGLMEIARRFNLVVIEDNPYGELRFEGEALPTLKSMDTDGRVVYLGSFSKILCPGMRLGWMVASKEILELYRTCKQGCDLQSSTVEQYVVDTFLTDNNIDEHVQSIIDVYRRRRDLMLKTIEEEFPASCSFTRPTGGLFTWITLPEHVRAADLLPACAEKNVVFIPGDGFYPEGNVFNNIRMNYSNATDENIVKGIKIMGEVIRANI